MSKNDSYAQVQSSGRNGDADCFPRLESRLHLFFFFFFFFFDGLVSGAQEEGSECSLTAKKPNLLLEEMLKSDNPADILLTKPDSKAIQKPQTPLPLAGNCISLVTLHSLRSGKSL